MTLKEFGDMLLDTVLRKNAYLKVRTANGVREVRKQELYKFSVADRALSRQAKVKQGVHTKHPIDPYKITAPFEGYTEELSKVERG